MENLMQTLKVQEEELSQSNKLKIAEVQELQVRVQEAKTKSMEEKQKQAREVAEEGERLRAQAEAAAAAELEAKRELIRQIREIEEARNKLNDDRTRNPNVDFTATANLGLLTEMSIAELQERIKATKSLLQHEIEARKADIKAVKEEKHRRLQEKHDFVVRSRETLNSTKRNAIEKANLIKSLLNTSEFDLEKAIPGFFKILEASKETQEPQNQKVLKVEVEKEAVPEKPQIIEEDFVTLGKEDLERLTPIEQIEYQLKMRRARMYSLICC
jgi:hypothetical protein